MISVVKTTPEQQRIIMKNNQIHIKSTLVTLTIALALTSLISLADQQANEQPLSEQKSSSLSKQGPCKNNWFLVSQKCFKFFAARTFEGAKARCQELSAQLSYIEDESAKERESSNSPEAINIFNYLSRESRPELQSKHLYVNLSSELLQQYQERLQNGFYSPDGSSSESYDHLDSDLPISDMWLPRDDPSMVNISTPDRQSALNPPAFVLAFSRHYKRWGLVGGVSPNRRMPYLCELPANLTAISQTTPKGEQNHSVETTQKRTLDLNSQPSSASVHSQHSPISSDQKKPIERESITTVGPVETNSMLFREFPQDQSIVLGSTVEMRCSALETESNLMWTFNGESLSQSNRVKVHPNGSLRIEHVRNTDDGNYTCTIHSGGMSESKSARLEIIERPHHPEYITAELLDTLSTSVRIIWTPGFNGNSPIKKYLVEMRTVDKDNIDSEMGSIMQSNLWEVAKANISADQTSVIIPDLKPAKKYIFRIKATNKVGTGDPSLPTKPPIEVPVQPPSMPPENLNGSPKSSTSIAVQWSPPPADSQNGPIKGYKIRHKLAGYASDWYTNDISDAAHLTFVLEDLIVWQNYEIQLAAENDKGVGPFSSSIYVRTKEGRPDKGPRNVTAEAVSPTAIKVNWNPPPPQHINGFNQGYKVQAWYDVQHVQLAKELIVPHNTLSPFHTTIVDSLLPYTEYHITVKCYTNAGDGPSNEDIVALKTKQDLPEAVPQLEFADILDKSLRVTWKPPHRINGELDHYTLEYSESQSSDKKILKKFPASATEARITDLTPQTSYYFKIYPHTNVGQGPGKANHTTTSIPPVLPEPPSSLVYSNLGPYTATIQFSPGFDGNAHIEKWLVEALTPMRGEYAPRWQTIYISTNHSQGNSLIVRNLRPFTRYRIRLTPVNIVGPSRYPSEPTMEFQTSQTEPEQFPRDLSIEDIKSNSVIVHWSPLANSLWLGSPRGYNLTWSESNHSAVNFHFINDTRVDSHYVRDLEEFTEYSFRIYAVNEAGTSPPSDPVVVTTLEDVPSSGPTNVTVHALSSNAISVDWNAIPKRHRNGILKGYKIQYQAQKPGAPLQHKTVEDNSTKHVTLNDLKAFTNYQLAIAAFTSVGDGVFSSIVNAQTLEDTPGTPQNLSFPTVSQTSARILWDPPENPNGDIIGYKVSYHTLTDSKEIASHELHQNEHTFKANNLKPDTHYVFTVTAKTKEGWGQQASMLLYTYDSELRANLPFYKEGWFVILCACLSIVITIIITALLFVQTKSYKYKQDAIKSTSQDRLGDAGFSIDDDANNHYNNGFGLLSNAAHHRRSIGTLSQNTANFTLPKSPPRPHPGSVVYSDGGDDDVFEEPVKRIASAANYDSSGDSLTEKPSEISSSTGPESESADEEYGRHFVNHYANVNGTLKGQKAWKKNAKHYVSQKTKPKLPQRPAPSVPQVPGEPSSSGSENATQLTPSTSGVQSLRSTNSIYGESSQGSLSNQQQPQQPNSRSVNATNTTQLSGNSDANNNNIMDNQNTQPTDLLNSHIVNLNGGRIIVDNMAGSRAPLPGFTSFV